MICQKQNNKKNNKHFLDHISPIYCTYMNIGILALKINKSVVITKTKPFFLFQKYFYVIINRILRCFYSLSKTSFKNKKKPNLNLGNDAKQFNYNSNYNIMLKVLKRRYNL